MIQIKKYEDVKKVIDENIDIIDFLDSGTSDSEINIAQDRLNVIFPPSYVWWLKNYGGGQILGEEIFSVYEIKPYAIPAGDIVYKNELDRKNKFTDITQLVIQTTDRSEVFYFDLLHPDENGEYPVYRNFIDSKKKYANDFLDFLIRRIKDEY